jgi:hypothetical protein
MCHFLEVLPDLFLNILLLADHVVILVMKEIVN